MNLDVIRKRAKRKIAEIERKKKDPRYEAVLGRLVKEGLLVAKNLRPNRLRPTLEDALWVGEIEPRVLELLPAILARRPRLFLQARPLPEDLRAVVGALKRGKAEQEFRGIPAAKYAAWEEFVRLKGPTKCAVAKIYRWQEEDLAALEKLKNEWQVCETEALRKALHQCVRQLATAVLPANRPR